MKVKKYRAADSQQAMRMVKAAHGPDAVVLDCYSIEGGFEIVVNWDGDDSVSTAAPPHAGTAELGAVAALQKRQHSRQAETATAPVSQNSGAGPRVVWSQDRELLTLKEELASMKSMLMAQLNGHSWQEADHQVPQQEDLHHFMAALDMEPELGRKLAAEIPAGESESVQREMLKMLLTQRLPVATPPSQGAIALVGPQGGGKTTTIAKLAAQHVLNHGRDSVAILTTDNARVGAQEQLRAYGRILQVPVHGAMDAAEAVKSFRLLRQKSLLLVDTAGVSFRDRQGLADLQQMLAAMPGLEVYLNLPSDIQGHVQQEIINAYRPLMPRGAAVARIDEAGQLGAVISNLISHQLPACWVTNGPNVPRNLSVADAGKLIKMAVRMAMYIQQAGQPRSQPETVQAGGRVSAVG